MNYSNQSTNVTTTPYIVTTEFWIMYVVFYIILGVLGIFENAIIIVLISLNKKLRTFFFVLIGGHCLGQIFYCTGNIVVGIYRLLPSSFPDIINITRLQCHFINLLVYFCPSFSSLTMVILAADRSYAIGKPMSYHKYSAKRALIVMSGSLLFTVLIKVVPSYTGSTLFSSQVPCVTARAAVTPDWWIYNYYVNCILIFLGILMYSALLGIAMIRARALSSGTFSNDDLANRLLKKQLKLLGTIRILIIINVLTVLPFVVLLIMSNYFPPPIASKLVVYGASLNAVDMVVEPVTLYASSTALKNGLKLVLKKNVVGDSQMGTKLTTMTTTTTATRPGQLMNTKFL